MTRTRTIDACHKAAVETLCQQYWREAAEESELARQHLASLTPARRAQLEREWMSVA